MSSSETKKLAQSQNEAHIKKEHFTESTHRPIKSEVALIPQSHSDCRPHVSSNIAPQIYLPMAPPQIQPQHYHRPTVLTNPYMSHQSMPTAAVYRPLPYTAVRGLPPRPHVMISAIQRGLPPIHGCMHRFPIASHLSRPPLISPPQLMCDPMRMVYVSQPSIVATTTAMTTMTTTTASIGVLPRLESVDNDADNNDRNRNNTQMSVSTATVSATKEHRYQCDQCPNHYRYMKDLKRHQKLHDENAPECQYCGRKFSDKRRLEDHIRTHTGETPFQCSKCQRKFGSERRLNLHSLTHSRDPSKPYECPHCAANFVYKRKLNAHVRGIHTQPDTGRLREIYTFTYR